MLTNIHQNFTLNTWKYKVFNCTLCLKVLFNSLLKNIEMKISRKKFVISFLVSAFAFQFVSNSALGTEIQLFPDNGEWYPGVGSPIAWKNTVSSIIYPAKYILIEPLSFLGQEPDFPPPVLLIAFAIYWTVIALVLHFLFSQLFKRTKA